ncbi:MAG: YraN family protein [Clostridiales bacterium]|jgi:putative endonuclease|nr:YraN family protein [Clostridiales bacterium]
MRNTHALGKSGEDAAVAYLKRKKFSLIERGFRFHRGEIDIIAYDGETLVFIEVKTRRDSMFGLPEESVTPAKQAQLRRVAEAYLMVNNLCHVPCRFDILSVSYDEKKGYKIRHLENAF